MDPLVSVIVATYNRKELLEKTLESILNQTYSNLEIIVVDDASTDGTMELRLFHNQSKIRYIRKENNSGPSAARNVGIRNAKGDLIAFIDDDDLWEKDKIKRQVETIDKKKVEWVYSDCVYFDHETGRKLYKHSNRYRLHSGNIASKLICGDFIPSPTPLIKKHVFDIVGTFEESSRLGEDWLMWLKIASKFPVEFIREPLARYRVHTGSVSKKENIEKILSGALQTINYILAFFPSEYSAYKRKAFQAYYLCVTKKYLSANDPKTARYYLHEGIKSYGATFNLIFYMVISFLPFKKLKLLRDKIWRLSC